MNDLPHVCVLLASFNGRQWIEEQIDSILSQGGVDVSVLVSDDGSRDGTANWLTDRSVREPRLRLLPGVRPSGSSASNFARLLRDVNLDGVDYLAFSDQDDLWLPGKLARGVHQLRMLSADAYSSNTIALFPDGSTRVIRKDQPQRRYDHYFESAGPGSSFVLERQLALQLQTFVRKLFDSQMGDTPRLFAYHDWFIYCFARCTGFRWIIDDQALVMYRQHACNEVGANIGAAALRERLRKLRSGWYFEEVRWLCTLMAPLAQHAGRPALDREVLLMRGFMSRARFAATVGPQARRRWRDRWGLIACTMIGLVR